MANFDKNRFRTQKQQWETPDELFDYLNLIYNFDLDLAGDSTNTKCKKFYSKEDNALSKEWKGVCWLNPPYGEKKSKLSDWIKKSFDESNKKNCMVVMLIPARTNTNWWHDYCMKSEEVLFIKGRPKFKGCVHGLPQPLALVVFGNNGNTKFATFDLSIVSDFFKTQKSTSFGASHSLNKDLEVSATPTPKEFPLEIPSLNPDIKRNWVLTQGGKNECR